MLLLGAIDGDDVVVGVFVVMGGATLGATVSGFTKCIPIDSGSLLELSFAVTTELVRLAIDPLFSEGSFLSVAVDVL